MPRKNVNPSPKRMIRRLLYRFIFPYAGLFMVKVLSSTYRLRIIDGENESSVLNKDGSIIYASWHQRFFPGITFFARRKPIAILISQSRDGEFISHIVDILGWSPVRGSSSRGGSEGLQRIKELSLNGHKIGHIVDGPKGPFGVVKPGLLRIAQVSGMAIVPTITSSENPWTFRSWDRFMVPRPFSRVVIRFGRPVYAPSDLEGEDFERHRLMIEQNLKELYEDTDRIWSDEARKLELF
jgi:lysophospholipid acyltransferase (LPLAT)-like uncharacterized protein